MKRASGSLSRAVVALIAVPSLSLMPLGGCAKRGDVAASHDAAPSAVTEVDARAPPRKREPLPAAPNKDFRLTGAPTPARKLGSVVVDGSGHPFVEVIGVDAPDRVHVDEPFVVRTYFKVLGTTTEDADIGLHLDSPTLKSRFNGDHAPIGGGYATTQWKSGELLVDATMARLERAGSYNLYVFFTAKQGVLRMKVSSGPAENNSGSWRIPVGAIEAE